MQCVLQEITVEVYRNLHPDKLSLLAFPMDCDDIADADKLQLDFIQQAFCLSNKVQLTNYVQNAQRGCIDLCDRVWHYGRELPQFSLTTEQKDRARILYSRMQDRLLGFYKYLEKNFTDHFDFELPLPASYWEEKAPALIQDLHALYGIADPAHLGFLKMAFIEINNKLDNRDNSNINMRQLRYWQKVLDQLRKVDLISETERGVWLIDWLLRLNCNGNILLSGIMNQYHSESEKLDSIPEQLEYWYARLMSVEILMPEPGMHLHPDVPDSISILSNFIQQEIRLLEKKLSFPNNVITRQQLITSLSVAQLGLFFRLQVDAKMLDISNKTALIKSVSDNYRTTRTGNISRDKLYNKFYSADSASISIMRTHLVNMLNLLKTY